MPSLQSLRADIERMGRQSNDDHVKKMARAISEALKQLDDRTSELESTVESLSSSAAPPQETLNFEDE